MKKVKYEFNDALHHTEMVLSGRKTTLMLPAPLCVVANPIVANDELLLITSKGRIYKRFKLPLVVGEEYAIPRPYRDVDTQLTTKEGLAKYGYAWYNKQGMKIENCEYSFVVDSIEYKHIDKVTRPELTACGVDCVFSSDSASADGSGVYQFPYKSTTVVCGDFCHARHMIYKKEFGESPVFVYIVHFELRKREDVMPFALRGGLSESRNKLATEAKSKSHDAH